MSLFSSVRSFSTLIRFTIDNHPQGMLDQYLKILTSMTPVRLLHLVCISKAMSNWSSLDILTEENFFKSFDLKHYLDYWIDVKNAAE